MQVDPVSSGATAAAQPTPAQGQATSAFNLSFESLLKIIMAQLQYQDPLKPMDNFQFVSQLAQFSQIQIGENGNDKLDQVAAAQATIQATTLLGKSVEVPAGSTVISGTVTAISFANGIPTVSIQTAQGSTISNISMASISKVMEGN